MNEHDNDVSAQPISNYYHGIWKTTANNNSTNVLTVGESKIGDFTPSEVALGLMDPLQSIQRLTII